MSFNRTWSQKLALPSGTEWGLPYTSNVAECMVWKNAPRKIPDPYHDSLGKSKHAVPSHAEILRQSRQQEERFENDLANYTTTRLNSQLIPRPPTPMKITQRENYADNLSSYYADNGADGQTFDLNGRRQNCGYGGHARDSRLNDDISITSHIRARTVGPCEAERYAPKLDDDADLIASFLDARDSDTYEKAKRDIYEQSYQKQIEEERKRLYIERQREYDTQIRAHSGKHPLDERALQDALTRQARTSSYTSTRFAGRPPIPRPPPGGKTEHMTAYTDPRSRARRVICEPSALECDNLRVTAANTESAIQNLRHAAVTRGLMHEAELERSQKPVKRVSFRTRPQSATAHDSLHRKGGHFSGWRNATEDPMLRDDPWRMSKFQNVKSRVDNRWAADPYAYRKKDDGRVGLQFDCPPGEEMNVNLRIEATPSRTGYLY